MHIVCLPLLVMPRPMTMRAAKLWSGLVLWGLRVFTGLGYEVRGEIPKGPVLVASKHMSMWDTLALFYLLDDPAMVLKRELLSIPLYGWYAKKAGMIAVDRAAGASALRKLAGDGRKAFTDDRSIMIFPEGTRKAPGAPPDYKPGVAALYGMLDVPCVPVALNSGLYWTLFRKNPGTVTIEFLAPIAAGLRRAPFMEVLQERIEEGTARLVAKGRAELAARS